MRLPSAFLALSLMVLACSSEDGGGPCAARNGTYVMRFQTRDGNCGPQNETLVQLQDSKGTASTDCEASNTESADKCQIQGTATCPFPAAGPGYKLESKSTLTWTESGDGASGIIEMTMTNNGSFVCHGTYDVSVSRR